MALGFETNVQRSDSDDFTKKAYSARELWNEAWIVVTKVIDLGSMSKDLSVLE